MKELKAFFSDPETSPSAKVIIFVAELISVQRIQSSVQQEDITYENGELPKCAAICSAISQEQREHNLNLFRSGQVRIIVATDILSRGMDIKDINLRQKVFHSYSYRPSKNYLSFLDCL